MASLLLIGSSWLASVGWLEGRLQGLLVAGIEADLLHAARSGTLALQRSEDPSRLANDLGAAADARVTIIASDGVVLGDSEVDDLSTLDNHGARPEVLDARVLGLGSSRRHSDTLHQDMLYVAVPSGSDGAVVRAARPLDLVKRQAASLRLLIGVAGLLALAAAAVLSGVAAQVATRDLRALVARAQSLIPGEAGIHQDEITGLRRSFDWLAMELQRLVDTLADERDHSEAILSSMREGVISVSSTKSFAGANPQAWTLLGLTEGTRFEQSPLWPVITETVAVALDGAPNERELVLPGDRGTRTVYATATPIHAGGAVLVLRDVTELNRLERIRRDFVANVSHELRTPLSTILASAEALVDGALDDPEFGLRLADSMARNAMRLGTLVDDLLLLARAEAGAQGLPLTSVVIHAVAERAVAEVSERVPAGAHILALDVDPGLCALADARSLERALVNLLDNACKYSPSGSHVCLRAKRRGDDVCIEVVDDGPGVAPEHRARLFERFYRVDPGRSRAMGGTGLGLAIVRHIVQAQGGVVEMVPNHPQGSIFRVTLRASILGPADA